MGPGQSSSCSRAADVPLSDVEVYEFFRRYGVHVRANEGQDNQGNRLPQVVPASQDTDSFQNTFGFRGVLDEDEIFQTYAELPDDTHLPFVIPSVNDMDVEIEELQTKIRGLQEKLDSLSQENLQLRSQFLSGADKIMHDESPRIFQL
ncbi:unnamed protein product [Allacma fusca]|uniref:Uncharacterized protein n=1 Tax=Allacma fusca TaxID=39272 RepID=A0A8J2KXU7_9HEXA|nr:unnamed protein product [Allacma fusca]